MATGRWLAYSILIAVAIGLTSLIIAATIYHFAPTERSDFNKEIFKTSVQLVAITLIGVAVKFLLDDYQKRRDADQALRQRRMDALNRLTINYWQIRKSLKVISTHRSAKSYGEQMRAIIDYHAELHRLDNELFGEFYELHEQRGFVTDGTKSLLAWLDALIAEWEDKYPELASIQGTDPSKVPDRLVNLPQLKRVQEDECGVIHRSYELAVKPLRAVISDSKADAQQLNTLKKAVDADNPSTPPL